MIDEVREYFLFGANFDVLVCFACSQFICLCRFLVPLSGLPKTLKGQQLRTINSVSLYITATLIKMYVGCFSRKSKILIFRFTCLVLQRNYSCISVFNLTLWNMFSELEISLGVCPGCHKDVPSPAIDSWEKGKFYYF